MPATQLLTPPVHASLAGGGTIALQPVPIATPMTDAELRGFQAVFAGDFENAEATAFGEDFQGIRSAVRIDGRHAGRVDLTADATGRPLRIWLETARGQSMVLACGRVRDNEEWLALAEGQVLDHQYAVLRSALKVLAVSGPTLDELTLASHAGGAETQADRHAYVSGLVRNMAARPDDVGQAVRHALFERGSSAATLAELGVEPLVDTLQAVCVGSGDGAFLPLNVDNLIRVPPHSVGRFIERQFPNPTYRWAIRALLGFAQRQSEAVGNGRAWPRQFSGGTRSGLYTPASPEARKLLDRFLSECPDSRRDAASQANSLFRAVEMHRSIEHPPLTIDDFETIDRGIPSLQALGLVRSTARFLDFSGGFLRWLTPDKAAEVRRAFQDDPQPRPAPGPIAFRLDMPPELPKDSTLRAAVDRCRRVVQREIPNMQTARTQLRDHASFMCELETHSLQEILGDATELWGQLPPWMRGSARALLDDDHRRKLAGDRSRVLDALRALHLPVQNELLARALGRSSARSRPALARAHDISTINTAVGADYRSPVVFGQRVLDLLSRRSAGGTAASTDGPTFSADDASALRRFVYISDQYHRPGQPPVLLQALLADTYGQGYTKPADVAKDYLADLLVGGAPLPNLYKTTKTALKQLMAQVGLDELLRPGDAIGPELVANRDWLQRIEASPQGVVGEWMRDREHRQFADNGVQNPFFNPVREAVLDHANAPDFLATVAGDIARLRDRQRHRSAELEAMVATPAENPEWRALQTALQAGIPDAAALQAFELLHEVVTAEEEALLEEPADTLHDAPATDAEPALDAVSIEDAADVDIRDWLGGQDFQHDMTLMEEVDLHTFD